MMFFRLMGQGMAGLLRSPWTQFLTLAAVTLTAFLGSLFLLALHTMNAELLTSKGSVAFQVYWQPQQELSVVQEQWHSLQTLPDLTAIQTFTPQQALEALNTQLSGTQESVARDLLPGTALLTFSPAPQQMQPFIEKMLARLRALPGVMEVHYNPLQVDFAHSWQKFSIRVLWPLIGFLGLIVALVVGNTIKLSMLARSEEVEILQLVGAGHWYIRLPLLTTGALQGFLGAVLALAMLKGVQVAAQDLFSTPPLHIQVRYLPLNELLLFIAGMVMTGIVASIVALRD